MGDRKTDAYTDKKVGITSYHLGDYLKAKEYLHKALAIRIQIGDLNGEARSYGNLKTVFVQGNEQLIRSYRKAKSPHFTLILVPNKHAPLFQTRNVS